jgi:2-amino-4-hydroxy-6-hydroxymethyldihydropteridine diphosphokinase
MNFAFLLLGSNLDDRSAMLQRAREEISSEIGKISRESSVYESEPWGFQAEQKFLNQVIRIETDCTPLEVLGRILEIEIKLGRVRAGDVGYASRLIDIDILFYNDEIIAEDQLNIPHPKIPDRMFTLLPLSELDKSMIHPGSHRSILDLMNACQDKLSVYPYRPK